MTSPCFLTPAESSAWLAARGLAEDPSCGGPNAHFFQFAPRPSFVSLRELFVQLLADSGSFCGGLLRFGDWHWEGRRECDPTASYRLCRGDPRLLHEVPGFVFGADELRDAGDLLALVVERLWSARFYAASREATLVLRDGNQVDVHAADLVTERRIQHRLAKLGAVLFIP